MNNGSFIAFSGMVDFLVDFFWLGLMCGLVIGEYVLKCVLLRRNKENRRDLACISFIVDSLKALELSFFV